MSLDEKQLATRLADQSSLRSFSPEPERVVVDHDAFSEDGPLSELRRSIVRDVGFRLGKQAATLERDELERRIQELGNELIDESGTPIARSERMELLARVSDETLGHGPLEAFLSSDEVTEIMVNGPNEVWVEQNGLLELTDVRFDDVHHLERVIDRIVSQVGRRIDQSSPMVDARLADGSRVNAIIPPLALGGPFLTIRRFRKEPYKMKDLVNIGTLTPKAAVFLQMCVSGGANVLISGGTGSGKTTTLNVLSEAIPDRERIATIEDAAELQLQQRHVLRMESRPANIEGEGSVSIRDLVRNSLRMRPDRIIVGECRGGEAVDMLQAMNTGHDGCMTTVHANTPRDAISRLETLVLTAGVDLPSRAILEQVGSAFDMIVQIERLVDGSRRVTAITEVVGMESGTVTLQDIFKAKSSEERTDGSSNLLGPLEPTGVVPGFLDKLRVRNVEIPVHLFQTREDKGPALNQEARTLRGRIAAQK
jgi:pilus assembly protein CpaF